MKYRQLINKIISLVIISFIFLIPILGIITSSNDEIISYDNRKIAQLPTHRKHFFDNLTLYLNDRLLFKHFFNENYGEQINRHISQFDFNPFASVVRGQEAWLFLGNNYNFVYSQHTEPLKMRIGNLQRYLARINELKSLIKVHVFCVVGPDKHGIYSEKMHKRFGHPGQYRVLDQIKNYLSVHDIKLIDPYEYLIKHKNIGQLYFTQDTHWNLMGAYYGMKYIFKKINQDIIFKELNFVTEKSRTGDLVIISGKNLYQNTMDFQKPILEKDILVDFAEINDKQQYTKINLKKLFMPVYTDKGDATVFINKQANNKSSILLIGDSFFEIASLYSILNFEQVIFMHRSKYSINTVRHIKQKFNIDFVIYETVERDMY